MNLIKEQLDAIQEGGSVRLSENGTDLVVVRADAGAPYAAVRELLADARAAGAKRLAIATRQKTEVR